MGKIGKENKRNNRIKHVEFKDLNISLLDEHQREGNKLLSPFSRLEKLSFLSWGNDALNEVLWAVILRTNIDQEECLQIFRAIVINARENIPEHKNTFITHSALSALDDELFDQLMRPVLENKKAKKLLSALLYFECLPDRKHWIRHLDNSTPNSHIKLLMDAVAKCLDHKSQESTDICWFKVMYIAIAQERIFFPETMPELVEELRLYPNYGDQEMVKPIIRTHEMSFRNPNENGIPPELKDNIPKSWSETFWKECYKKTECITINTKNSESPKESEYSDQIFQVYHQLAEHFIESATNTNLDPRRDTCFGIVLYSLCLATELSASTSPLSRRSEGRIILRTIVENFITLKYLEYKDNPTIWVQFRTYGVGKSKMAFLKNLQQEDIPSFINLQDLHNYANEDMWQEFGDIDIKSWTDKNLRQMAQQAGIKDFYDKHYDWSSGYVHGNWSAIRDTIFTTCLNPLHRFHRIPFVPRLDMPDVIPDIAKTINVMLEIVNRFYPSFKLRIKHPSAGSGIKKSK